MRAAKTANIHQSVIPRLDRRSRIQAVTGLDHSEHYVATLDDLAPCQRNAASIGA